MACIKNPLETAYIKYNDDYAADVAKTVGVDYRIVDYCRNLERPNDVSSVDPAGCLSACYKDTTLTNVVDALDKLASVDQLNMCSELCESFELGTKESNDCTIDCYVDFDPNRFPITSATAEKFLRSFHLFWDPQRSENGGRILQKTVQRSEHGRCGDSRGLLYSSWVLPFIRFNLHNSFYYRNIALALINVTVVANGLLVICY